MKEGSLRCGLIAISGMDYSVTQIMGLGDGLLYCGHSVKHYIPILRAFRPSDGRHRLAVMPLPFKLPPQHGWLVGRIVVFQGGCPLKTVLPGGRV